MRLLSRILYRLAVLLFDWSGSLELWCDERLAARKKSA